jgi:hypothetical protein
VSGYAAVRDRPDREAAGRIASWARDYLHKAAVVGLASPGLGVAAAQLRFGKDVTQTYLALSLALPLLWLLAAWLAGGYDVRFIGTC